MLADSENFDFGREVVLRGCYFAEGGSGNFFWQGNEKLHKAVQKYLE